MRNFVFAILIPVMVAACTKSEDTINKTTESVSSQLQEVVTEMLPEDIQEDIIPDFSRVGYHYGDDPILSCSNIIATLTPTGDETDRTEDIQTALNLADGKTNSVVLLKAGDYYVGSTLRIEKSHVCLRGEGGSYPDWKTRIIATGKGEMFNCLVVGFASKLPIINGLTATEVAEPYVPVGRLSLKVKDASRFERGDRVMVYRPAIRDWIHAIRMDNISDGQNWKTDDMQLYYERIITKISGSRLFFDSPLVMAIDSCYGGAYVVKSSYERVCECGVEDIFFESRYNGQPDDEDHCSNAVKLAACEHCWVKAVSGRHFIFSLVGQGTGCKNVTIEDCHSYEPISLIQGSRRYAFSANSHSTMGLVKNCTADSDRHSFVTTERAPGPLVFTNCKASNCLNGTGPHCFWATGILYDCLKQDSQHLSVQDADFTGSEASHGWQGSCVVFWNCEAPYFVCQSPWSEDGHRSSGRNYCIGSIGIKKLSSVSVGGKYLNDRPQGEWVPDPGEGQSNTEHITSGTYYGATADGLSLYEAQLARRKAAGIRAIPAEWYN